MIWGKKKLLIIDDSEIMRTLFYAEFDGKMDIVLASDGTSGLAAVLTEKPHVIILDINMPDMSGLEVLQRLNSSAQTRHIPVVIITGDDFNPTTERQARMQKNCKGFLNKLASSVAIQEAVSRAMSFN
ncbi:MAG: response regulator [Elusimicrobiales bacterium]